MSERRQTPLERMRRNLGITQVVLAKRTGISVRQIVRYERQGVAPPLDKAQALAEALGCEIADLLDSGVCAPARP
jgi:transcriptional regulator with XRE-family HTH domain